MALPPCPCWRSCLPPTLSAAENRSYYPPKLAKWMDFFPRQQLHVLQVGARGAVG